MATHRFSLRFLAHWRTRVVAIAMAAPTLAALVVISPVALTAPQGRTAQPSPQPPQSGMTSLGTLFEPDLAELLPTGTDALKSLAEKAKGDRSECPDALAFKVVIQGTGDPLWRETLARARQDALVAFLRNHGLMQGRDYKLDKFDMNGPKDDVQVRFNGPEKPKLNTTSKPPKGTKVKAGDLIEVTMTATDDANVAQSGIRAIQLMDLQTNGLVDVKYFEDSSKCTASALRPPSFKAQPYKVPSNPPALVRLEATAEDFAGNVNRDLGVFPTTGHWYGTMKLHRQIVNSRYEHTITWTFAVSEVSNERQVRDGRGGITYTEVRGRALGQIDYTATSKWADTNCFFQHNIKPAQFEMEVTGERQDDRLIINFPDPGVIDMRRTRCVEGLDETEPFPFNDTVDASFDLPGVKDGARDVIPPSDSNDRVTTTMELFRLRQ
jgi:hypothetical protein